MHRSDSTEKDLMLELTDCSGK